MKWRRCATGTTLSRLFNGLVFVLLVKLAVLGSLLLDLPGRVVGTVQGVQQAQVEEQGAPLPPSTMPDALAQDAQPAPPADPATPVDPQAATAPAPESEDTGDTRRRREEDLQRREQSLRQLEKEIDDKLVRLQQLEARLQRMLEDAKGVQDEKLRHLIDVYANMKAKQAATVIETLDPNLAVKILAGMRGRQAGEILTNVQAEKAAKLTEMLTKMQVPFE